MNERIKELAKQADDYADTYCDTIALSYTNWNTTRDVKFAQLIVKECCQKLESDGMVEIAMEIKEHFGVEL